MIARLLLLLIVCSISKTVLSQNITLYGGPEWRLHSGDYHLGANYSIVSYYQIPIEPKKKKDESRTTFNIGLGFVDLSYQIDFDTSDYTCLAIERIYTKSVDTKTYAIQLPTGLNITFLQKPKFQLFAQAEAGIRYVVYSNTKREDCICSPNDSLVTEGREEIFLGTENVPSNIRPYAKVGMGIQLPFNKKLAIELIPAIAYNTKRLDTFHGHWIASVVGGVVFKLD